MKTDVLLFCLLLALSADSYTTAKAQAADVNDSLALIDLYNSTNGSNWNDHSNWLTAAPLATWFGVTVEGTRVTALDLSYNNLNGIIPSSIGDLTQLQDLSLGNNYLKDTIPSSIGNLGQLLRLYLFQTYLSGNIPSSIGNLTQLQTLVLHSNQLNGTIPSSIGNLTQLQGLYLNFNQLSGAIPSSIGNLTNLKYLFLAVNKLSGSIPPSIGNLIQLEELFLHDNQLSDSIPSSIGNLGELQQLFIYNNQLSGEIPRSFRNLSKLQYVYISNNQLTQSSNVDFPGFDRYYWYYYLNAGNNRFTFNGLEFIAKKFPDAYYTPQAPIHIHLNDGALSVAAGGSLSNNTYHWFHVGEADSTIKVGDSTFRPAQSGQYYAYVTNAIATKLTLYTDTVDFMLPAQSRIAASHSADKFMVYPNPAKDMLLVKVAGEAIITITDATGKLMRLKTVTNNSYINVSSLIPGIYYVQNKATGEIRKIVVAR